MSGIADVGDHPDLCPIHPHAAILVRRSRPPGPPPSPTGRPRCHQHAGALCAPPLWALPGTDFVVVLFGYAISGERTLAAFYERQRPWATAFMALFGRDRLPSRSALSRWLAVPDQVTVEALRTGFLEDGFSRLSMW